MQMTGTELALGNYPFFVFSYLKMTRNTMLSHLILFISSFLPSIIFSITQWAIFAC